MGPDRSHEAHEQILRESAALRAWAAAIRATSAAARLRSQTARSRAPDRRRRPASPPEPGPAYATPAPRAAPSGPDPWAVPEPVPISDLFLILVEHHGLGVREAVGALAVAMRMLGCPDDTEALPAADAIDIIQAIVHPERRSD
jgi:hypothetical protein